MQSELVKVKEILSMYRLSTVCDWLLQENSSPKTIVNWDTEDKQQQRYVEIHSRHLSKEAQRG